MDCPTCSLGAGVQARQEADDARQFLPMSVDNVCSSGWPPAFDFQPAALEAMRPNTCVPTRTRALRELPRKRRPLKPPRRHEDLHVGGAVRDQLSVGRWPTATTSSSAPPGRDDPLGYQPVGKDFPVFLHPHTHEEYALARTERKSGRGYKGFTVYAAPDVTLEEDLLRVTSPSTRWPWMKAGVGRPLWRPARSAAHLFRHVSAAFAEDPVRILRVARFAPLH